MGGTDGVSREGSSEFLETGEYKKKLRSSRQYMYTPLHTVYRRRYHQGRNNSAARMTESNIYHPPRDSSRYTIFQFRVISANGRPREGRAHDR